VNRERVRFTHMRKGGTVWGVRGIIEVTTRRVAHHRILLRHADPYTLVAACHRGHHAERLRILDIREATRAPLARATEKHET
jgi:hypothetical protein